MAPSDLTQFSDENRIKQIESALHLSNEDLKNMVDVVKSEMVKGLSRSDSESSLPMLPTYVNALPSGKERGCYMALDMGGTNFRVLLVKILDDHTGKKTCKVEMANEIFSLPEDIIVGEAEAFFDYIAKCMALFCKNYGLSDTHLSVGFTFSFGLQQHCINKATLLTWTKGFDVSGVVGNDVVELLMDAIRRRGDLKCEVVAILNDTVGTLLSCALTEPNCKIGLIVGTGCNACYMEKMSNIHTVEESDGEMCINMELGALGNNGVLDEFRNEFDEQVDADSKYPGKQVYEKMISGMYMGEITRSVLCKLTREGLLFNGEGSTKLFQADSFKTAYMSEIENTILYNKSSDNIMVRNILEELDLKPDPADCEVVQRICRLVSTRAALFCAAGVAGVAQKIKENHTVGNVKVTVGVDGSVYKKHPTFGKCISEKVKELCEESGLIVDFVLSHDGSGKGAALTAAAVADKVA